MLIDKDVAPLLVEEWLRAFIQIGLDDAAAGRITAWDADQMRQYCRERALGTPQ